MRSFVLASALAAAGAVGLADTAKAQVVVSIGGGPVFPGGGLVYTGGYGYGFSPYYGYSPVVPVTGYTLGRTYGLYTSPAYTYGSYGSYYAPSYYRSGYYGGYRRGYRRW